MIVIWFVEPGDSSPPGKCDPEKQYGWFSRANGSPEYLLTKRDAKKYISNMYGPATVWQVYVRHVDVIWSANHHHLHGPTAPAICRCRVVDGVAEWEDEPVRFTGTQFVRETR